MWRCPQNFATSYKMDVVRAFNIQTTVRNRGLIQLSADIIDMNIYYKDNRNYIWVVSLTGGETPLFQKPLHEIYMHVGIFNKMNINERTYMLQPLLLI